MLEQTLSDSEREREREREREEKSLSVCLNRRQSHRTSVWDEDSFSESPPRTHPDQTLDARPNQTDVWSNYLFKSPCFAIPRDCLATARAVKTSFSSIGTLPLKYLEWQALLKKWSSWNRSCKPSVEKHQKDLYAAGILALHSWAPSLGLIFS